MWALFFQLNHVVAYNSVSKGRTTDPRPVLGSVQHTAPNRTTNSIKQANFANQPSKKSELLNNIVQIDWRDAH